MTKFRVNLLIVFTHVTVKISLELARNVSRFWAKKKEETISVTCVKCQNPLLIINCTVSHLLKSPILIDSAVIGRRVLLAENELT